nr:unnamed protein product [Spirometra erinaceieuropaei]
MTDAGFFKGTSADQDSRFADKKKKLLKSMEFGDNLNKKRITELLTYEDDILCDYVFNQLSEQHPDPKEIQINMTGFLLSKNARIFISELWDLLLSAMGTPGGVPAVFLEAKKAELSQKQQPLQPTKGHAVDLFLAHLPHEAADPQIMTMNEGQVQTFLA